MSMTNFDRDERAAVQDKDAVPGQENLTPMQQELLRDMRESLQQMKRGEMLSARETLRELDLEFEAEDDADSSHE